MAVWVETRLAVKEEQVAALLEQFLSPVAQEAQAVRAPREAACVVPVTTEASAAPAQVSPSPVAQAAREVIQLLRAQASAAPVAQLQQYLYSEERAAREALPRAPAPQAQVVVALPRP